MPEPIHTGNTCRAAAVVTAVCMIALGVRMNAADPPKRLDPAAWGGDHVGRPVPEYTTGEECLFCHREKIGATWGDNRHQLTIRPLEADSPALPALKKSSAGGLVGDIEYLLGGRRRQRFLKPAESYGTLELLSTAWVPPQAGKSGELIHVADPHWDAKTFGESCAGCHTTAVDPKTKAFSALSLDCFACHGEVPTEHAKKPQLALLARQGKSEARVVTSVCAQCHVRTGTSKATGRPYPTNFVAGDNLFRDFQVDFSDQALNALSVADRHVLENVRDVALDGNEAVTCLSCHDVHGRSSKKHHRVARSDYCQICHTGDGAGGPLKPFSAHSKTCGY